MGHRLSKIYTRTGDDGSTGLGDGTRVRKDDSRIAAIGDVDELNCVIGLVLSHELPEVVRTTLTQIQHHLFDLGGELSIPDYCLIEAAHIQALEQDLDALNEQLPPLKEFILPGGIESAALCHHARAVCRRAERQLVSLGASTDINPNGRHYLNRLSDYLFVAARYLNKIHHRDDVLWRSSRTRADTD
jgi:cob(I)alamin adenosyltransferase